MDYWPCAKLYAFLSPHWFNNSVEHILKSCISRRYSSKISTCVSGTSPTHSNLHPYWFTRLVNEEPFGHTCVPLLLMVTSLKSSPVCCKHFSATAVGCRLLSINISTPTIETCKWSALSNMGLAASLKWVGVGGWLGNIGLGWWTGIFPILSIMACAQSHYGNLQKECRKKITICRKKKRERTPK